MQTTSTSYYYLPYILIIALIFSVNAGDSVIVTVNTVTYNGQYAPRNASMMWMQKPDNTFIKTICKRAQNYIRYCTLWNSISNGDVDGLTGASRNNHSGVLTGIWDCTGQNGQRVPDGAYEFWVEMTESNATGRNSHGTIIIDGVSKTVQGTNTANFQNFTAAYKATTTSANNVPKQPAAQVIAITRNNGLVTIRFPGHDDYAISMISSSGRICLSTRAVGNHAELDCRGMARGIYSLQATSVATQKTYLSRFIYR